MTALGGIGLVDGNVLLVEQILADNTELLAAAIELPLIVHSPLRHPLVRRQPARCVGIVILPSTAGHTRSPPELLSSVHSMELVAVTLRAID